MGEKGEDRPTRNPKQHADGSCADSSPGALWRALLHFITSGITPLSLPILSPSRRFTHQPGGNRRCD